MNSTGTTKMFSLPLLRKVVFPIVVFLAIIVIARILIEVKESTSTQTILRTLLRSSYGKPVEFNFTTDYDIGLSLEQRFIRDYHSSIPLSHPNPYVPRLFSPCHDHLNPHTKHIRLPNTHMLGISMVPISPNKDESTEEFKTNRYFNPTIIPLPSHIYKALTPYPYVLLTRLVTAGLHQESHICFADICSPSSASFRSTSSRICDESDLDLLGRGGGLRCVTTPEKLNIPPTPAKKCTGAWRTFPDIPGFHDPRMFWTGRKGEVLVEVNSGSAYGCAGLWIVDLRSVWPRLDEILKRSSKSKRHDDTEDVASKLNRGHDNHGKKKAVDLSWLEPPKRYQYLTEITRNPRSSRSEVEKNWVLFFPNEDEIWVQYDMVGSVVQSGGGDKIGDVSEVVSANNHRNASDELVAGNNRVIRTNTSTPSSVDVFPDTSHRKRENVTTAADPTMFRSWLTDPAETTSQYSDLGEGDASDRSDTKSSTTLEPTPSLSIEANIVQNITIEGGRTIAQILNTQAYTTTNLTSPTEPPCFDYHSWTYLHDSLNNSGHWHQGSNSLRLILCTRQQLKQRSCLSDTNSADASPASKNIADAEKNANSWNTYERLLLREGMIVHFSVIHKKFSNAWSLPMRYERYFLVWDARRPFRILGVSAHPILFGDERARPWSWEQDVGWHMNATDVAADSGKKKKSHIDYNIIPKERYTNSTSQNHPYPAEADENTPQPAKHKRSPDDHTTIDSFGGHQGGPPSKTPIPHSNPKARSPVYFTYTPSLSWSFQPQPQSSNANLDDDDDIDLGTGTLDDEIILGIGMDDVSQGFVKVGVGDVLGCLRVCY